MSDQSGVQKHYDLLIYTLVMEAEAPTAANMVLACTDQAAWEAQPNSIVWTLELLLSRVYTKSQIFNPGSAALPCPAPRCKCFKRAT